MTILNSYIDTDINLLIPFSNPDFPLFMHKGSGSLSFTRATTATYQDPKTGLILTAASGQLRIEKNGALIEGERTNLLPYSENFSAGGGWGAQADSTVSNNVVESPDGNTTADKHIEGSNNSARSVQAVPITTLADTYTFSIYLKAAERTWAWLSLDFGAVSNGCHFDLANGVVGTIRGTIVSAAIVDAAFVTSTNGTQVSFMIFLK